jgi:hypothetical protein
VRLLLVILIGPSIARLTSRLAGVPHTPPKKDAGRDAD